MKPTILFFNSNSLFDQNLKHYLQNKRVKIINISQKNIQNWQFILAQSENNKHFGNIISPSNKNINVANITGIYLTRTDWLHENMSPYEFNAWYAMLSWLTYTIPNSLHCLASKRQYSNCKLQYELAMHNISFSQNKVSHYAHCLDKNIFISTISGQMAILPPKTAKKLLAIIKKLGFVSGCFYLNQCQGSWQCSNFSANANWQQCAFPTSFILQSMYQFLTSPNDTVWQDGNLQHQELTTARHDNCFINKQLLPDLIGSSYQADS